MKKPASNLINIASRKLQRIVADEYTDFIASTLSFNTFHSFPHQLKKFSESHEKKLIKKFGQSKLDELMDECFYLYKNVYKSCAPDLVIEFPNVILCLELLRLGFVKTIPANDKEEIIDAADLMMLYYLYSANQYRDKNNLDLTIHYLNEAHETRRLLELENLSKELEKVTVTKFAKAGAEARHKETREMKDDVFKWCTENMASHKSMDKAASAVTEIKLVPVAWRTIRSWIGEWKKLQSASKM